MRSIEFQQRVRAACTAQCRPPASLMRAPCTRLGSWTYRLLDNPLHHRLPLHDPSCRPRQVLRRTSEHWWEDEQEFDAVAGEVLLPKTLYILALDDPCSDAAGSHSAAAVRHLKSALGDCSMTAGFCSPQCKAAAEAVWDALGAGGPPYFRKVRQREGLGSEAPKALSDLLAELLGQNWRVELDYGLQGGTLTPSEHILLVTNRHSAHALVSELQAGPTEVHKVTEQLSQNPPGGAVLLQVQVRGWNTDGAAKDHPLPLRNWRDDLKPALVNVKPV